MLKIARDVDKLENKPNNDHLQSAMKSCCNDEPVALTIFSGCFILSLSKVKIKDT